HVRKPSRAEPAAKLAERAFGNSGLLAFAAGTIAATARGRHRQLVGRLGFHVHGMRDEGLKLVVAALGEIRRRLCDGAEKRLEPVASGPDGAVTAPCRHTPSPASVTVA